MGVLRIADYLDLHAERAPSNLLKVKALRSSISQREWAAHAAITDIRYGGSNDPERLEIIAEPSSAAQYTSVLRWVEGIQSELDHTWATLGEVYGGVKNLSKLGLRLRRVTSPLQDRDRYSSQRNLSYVPKLAAFRATETALLPLLAKPLYGDRPEVGIRELMQNAIDAVNERKSLQKSGKLSRELAELQYAESLRSIGVDVIIDVCTRGESDNSSLNGVPDDWEHWVEVVDGGVGMTPQTVTDYFLCAGASFRRSLEWQRAFASGKGDGVVRCGQFGIGTLALFLLGDEVCVTTRHYSEERLGTQFRARLSDDEIELKRQVSPLGTSICIRITKEAFESLAGKYDPMRPQRSWDWFCLDSPRILCRIRRGDDIEIRPQSVLVSLNDIDHSEWRTVECDAFDRVIWRPANESWRHRLYANGILVASWHRNFDRNLFSDVTELKQPDVLVIDQSSNLELNLTRNDVIGVPGYKEAVERDALLDHCAWLLAQAGMPANDREPFQAPMWEKQSYMSPGDGVVKGPCYIVTEKGLVPLTAWHVHRAGIRILTTYFTSTNSYISDNKNDQMVHFPPKAIFKQDMLPTAYASFVLDVFGGFGPVSHTNVAIEEFSRLITPIIGQDAEWVLVMPTIIADRLDVKGLRSPQLGGGGIRHLTPAGWSVLGGDSYTDVSSLLSLVLGPNSPIQSNNAIRGFAQMTRHASSSQPKEDKFASVWAELRLPDVLPFDAALRQKQCAHAELMLAKHIARYTKI
nr:hypothetical protein [Bremerella cremea]